MPYNSENIFSKIIKGQIPCDKIYEDKNTLAFNDINPVAPVHILVLPKGLYTSFDDFVMQEDKSIIAEFFTTVRKIANDAGLVESGYRLIMNHGYDASQTVEHFHVHIIGGKALGGLLAEDRYIR